MNEIYYYGNLLRMLEVVSSKQHPIMEKFYGRANTNFVTANESKNLKSSNK